MGAAATGAGVGWGAERRSSTELRPLGAPWNCWAGLGWATDAAAGVGAGAGVEGLATISLTLPALPAEIAVPQLVQ